MIVIPAFSSLLLWWFLNATSVFPALYTCVTPVKMLLSEEIRQLSLHNQVKREKFSIFFSTVKRKNVEKGLLNKNNGEYLGKRLASARLALKTGLNLALKTTNTQN